jgi:eukaryotic-like serine/threonine-protein kinase
LPPWASAGVLWACGVGGGWFPQVSDNERATPDANAARPPGPGGPASGSLVGQVISGRYRVIEALATGAMGAVYRGEHIHMRKRVAIKVLLPEAEKLSELVARFEREAIVGAHVAHPNIACATDFGQLDDGSFFLVLEFVKGATLRQLIRQGPLTPRRATVIARQIASALAEVHGKGVIHRDLKPANIMLVEGEQDLVKLIDFGFARVDVERLGTFERTSQPPRAARPLTGVGMVVGTVAYLSPEARFGMDHVDARSDLYALGIMLYEMLSGARPFDCDDTAEMLRMHALTPPPSLRDRFPQVPATLEAVIMSLLSKDPAARMQTGGEALDALDRVLLSLEPEATGPSSAAPVSPRSISVPGPSLTPRPTHQLPPLEGPRLPALRITAPREAVGDGDERSSRSSGPGAGKTAAGLLALVLVACACVLVVARSHLGEPGLQDEQAALAAAAAPSAAEALADVAPSAAQAAEAAASAASSTAPAVVSAVASAVPAPSPRVVAGRNELKAAAKAKDWPRAAGALAALGARDAAAFRERDVVASAALTMAALDQLRRPEAPGLYDLLAGRLGEGGPDVLFAMASSGRTMTAVRAATLLRREDVLARASKAVRIALALRESPCVKKAELLGRAGAEGDARMLPELEALRVTECRRKHGCCLKDSPALARAISDIGARGAR